MNLLFDKEKLDNLIILYNKAIKENKESFIFEGEEILTTYAKYLIEYLKTKIR